MLSLIKCCSIIKNSQIKKLSLCYIDLNWINKKFIKILVEHFLISGYEVDIIKKKIIIFLNYSVRRIGLLRNIKIISSSGNKVYLKRFNARNSFFNNIVVYLPKFGVFKIIKGAPNMIKNSENGLVFCSF